MVDLTELVPRDPLTRDGKPVFVPRDELRAGDVLLSTGKGLKFSAAWWVRVLDGSGYSHVSFFDGERLIEATLEGVITASVEERVQGQAYVDVYRYVSNGGEYLAPADADAVGKAAKGYIGHKYAHHDLVFAGLLAMSRRVNLPLDLEDAVRLLLSNATDALMRIFDTDRRRHLTCSELVYRAFREAEPEPKYALGVPSRFPVGNPLIPSLTPVGLFEERPSVAGQSVLDKPGVAEAARAFALLYQAHLDLDELPEDWRGQEHFDLVGRLEAVTASLDGRTEWVAAQDADWLEPEPNYVSIYDLAHSRNLVEMGRARKQDYPSS